MHFLRCLTDQEWVWTTSSASSFYHRHHETPWEMGLCVGYENDDGVWSGRFVQDPLMAAKGFCQGIVKKLGEAFE